MSPRSDEQGTRADVRRYIITTAVIVFLATFLLTTGQQVRQTEDDRATCEGQNHSRASEYRERRALVAVNIGRVAAASSPSERAANQVAVATYRGLKWQLVHGIPDRIAGTVKRDCDAAFRKPFPFSLFD